MIDYNTIDVERLRNFLLNIGSSIERYIIIDNLDPEHSIELYQWLRRQYKCDGFTGVDTSSVAPFGIRVRNGRNVYDGSRTINYLDMYSVETLEGANFKCVGRLSDFILPSIEPDELLNLLEV